MLVQIRPNKQSAAETSVLSHAKPSPTTKDKVI